MEKSCRTCHHFSDGKCCHEKLMQIFEINKCGDELEVEFSFYPPDIRDFYCSYYE